MVGSFFSSAASHVVEQFGEFGLGLGRGPPCHQQVDPLRDPGIASARSVGCGRAAGAGVVVVGLFLPWVETLGAVSALPGLASAAFCAGA